MKSTKGMAVLFSAALLFVSGCGTKPVYNVNGAPVATSKANASLDDVKQAIVRAGAALGWQMRDVKPGHIEGSLYLRTHVAKVDVMFDTKSFGITYKDSTNLDYDGTNIHNNYNGWIQNLEKGIRTQLSLI